MSEKYTVNYNDPYYYTKVPILILPNDKPISSTFYGVLLIQLTSNLKQALANQLVKQVIPSCSSFYHSFSMVIV